MPPHTHQPPEDTCPDRPDSPAWRVGVVAAGAALVVTAGFTLTAWAIGNPEYVQISPSRPPLHYNAALGLGVWGLGFLALACGRFRAARVGAAVLWAGSLVLTTAHVPASGIRLDRWAFPPPETGPPFPPGGAAPGMAFALFLAGAALALAGRRNPGGGRTLAVALIGLVLAVGAPTALALGPAVPAALLGGVGTGLGGLALLLAPFRRGRPSGSLGSALPAGVGGAGVVLSVAVWAILYGEQDRRMDRQVQFEAAHAHRATQERLARQVSAVVAGAGEWAGAEPAEFRDQVGAYVGQNPGCLGVARVGEDLGLTWVEHRLPTAPPASLAGVGVADAVADGVREGRVVVARPPRSHWGGVRVLVIYAPAPRPGPAAGGFVSVFRLQDLFDSVLNRNVAAGYALTVSDGPEALFTRYPGGGGRPPRWAQTLRLSFHGFQWRMEVWPTREVLDRESLSLPGLALLVGLTTTALLALAAHLALTARRRARALELEVRERELTQSALQQSEQKYRTLIENLGQGVFLQDGDLRYAAANPEFCRNVGRTEAEVIGRTDAELFDPRRAARYADEVRAVLAEGKTVEGEEEWTAGGGAVRVRRVLTPVRDAAGRTTGVLGICWDVTEQRLLEARVHQASKMDAIGQLAGGIAHDFNNLLTAIIGNLELILDDPDTGEPTRELAGAAQNAATRAASLTKRLLGFARRHQLDWLTTDLNGIVDEVVVLLRRTIDPLIRIDTRPAPGSCPVRADPAQLNQVLMNLCLNARDAIPGAGRITVETACVAAADLPPGCGAGGRDGEFVRLTVADTGAGMSRDVQARMYEPFFTTKDVGKGTGLGLPMVFATVRQHKGWIECRSEPGRGTRFDVYLPRAEAVADADARPDPPDRQRFGNETVLVVDDEDIVRRLAVQSLRGRGYRVLEAGDGQQALDVYAGEGGGIDLVVLDLTMPVLSGHEAFRHLLRLNPQARVMFASGYSAEQLSDVERRRMAGFVSKPYRPNDLVTAVEAALRRDAHEFALAAD